MIHELIVTSVPRGLQAGRSGFTTVLRTRGIHPQLAETLERASGYRHVFPQGDPRNPQIRSHSVVSGAAGVVSILSRITDAGSDYSGRSNKLAHHIALDSRETVARAASNPAAVLLALERSGGYQRQWSGEPREQPTAPQVPTVPSEPGACRAWATLAGDGGWAGLLVDRALAKQPTWIIAPQGLDLLELFAEALGLVNYPQRWGITFTTYALSAGDGLWLGTVDGSPESHSARSQSRLAVVDLVRRAPLTATSPLIEAARGTGPVPWKRDFQRPPTVPNVPTPSPTLPAGSATPGLNAPGPGALGSAADASRGTPTMPPLLSPGVPPAMNGGPPRLAPTPTPGVPAEDRPLLRARGSWSTPRQHGYGPWIASAIVLLLVASGAIAFVLLNPQQERETSPDNSQIVDRAKAGPPAIVKQLAEPMEREQASEQMQSEIPQEHIGPSDEELAAEQKRQDEEKARLEAEQKMAARTNAFSTLRKRVEDSSRLPLKAQVHLQDEREQKIEICELGDTEVEVCLSNLPKVALIPDKPQWQMECTGPHGGPWSIKMTSDEKAEPPLEIARIENEQGKLTLTLLPMPALRDPLGVAAREALTTAPLLLRLPGETSAEFETFVQLCEPKRLDPIVLEQLLTDRKWLPKGKNPGQAVPVGPLLNTPWRRSVELHGKLQGEAQNGISGAMKPPPGSSPTDTDNPGKTVEKPLQETLAWEWSGEKTEPFIETTLELQSRDQDLLLGGGEVLDVRLRESKVLPYWSHWKRLGDFGDSRGDYKGEKRGGWKEPQPMKHIDQGNKFFKQRLPAMPQDTSNQKKAGQPSEHPTPAVQYTQQYMAEYAEMARQYVPEFSSKDVARLLSAGVAEKMEYTEAKWQERIRNLLKASQNYQQWAKAKAPMPPGSEPNREKEPDKHHNWVMEKEKHTKYLEAGVDVTREFWDQLKSDVGSHEAKKVEVILCCLHFELEPVLAEKRKTKKLLEAVGDGTVELTGKVWASPSGDGKYKVLLAEFTDPPAASPAPPAANEAVGNVAESPPGSTPPSAP